MSELDLGKELEITMKILERALSEDAIDALKSIIRVQLGWLQRITVELAGKENFYDVIRNDETLSEENKKYWLSFEPKDE